MEFTVEDFFCAIFCCLKKMYYLCSPKGKMAEWSIAAVLKTVDLKGFGGSNPSLSANKNMILAYACIMAKIIFLFEHGARGSVRGLARIPLFQQSC